jgi:hypothetical protein
MPSIDNLLSFYFTIAKSYWLMGVTSRLALAAALYVVWAGNKRPGWRLLSGAFSVLFLLAGFIAFGNEGPVVVLSLSSLALAAAFGVSAYRDDAEWQVAPREGGGLFLVLAVYLFAFEFPFWGVYGYVFSAFFPPFGPLPHQTLLVVLLCLMLSGKRIPLYTGLASMVLGVVIGLLDLLGSGNVTMGVTMLIFVLGAMGRLGFDLVASVEAPIKAEMPKRVVSVKQQREKINVPKVKPSAVRSTKTVKTADKKKKKWDIG